MWLLRSVLIIDWSHEVGQVSSQLMLISAVISLSQGTVEVISIDQLSCN